MIDNNTKVIFSRKGFDSSAGHFPSPIFEDGKMISLPIPLSENDRKQALKHKITQTEKCEDVIEHILSKKRFRNHLDKKEEIINRYYGSKDKIVHFDPYLYDDKGYGIFGQANQAASHLLKYKVGENTGDIFLFYGWFDFYNKNCKIAQQCKIKNIRHGMHVIYGFLIVDSRYVNDQINNIPRKLNELLHNHPHYKYKSIYKEKNNNTIYIGKKYGLFNFSDRYILSKENQTKSKWWIFDRFKNIKMTRFRQEYIVYRLEPSFKRWVNEIIASI